MAKDVAGNSRVNDMNEPMARGYRSGFLPECLITLGSGSVPVKVPRVRGEVGGEKFQ